jgi:hypothetical protein
LCASSKINHYSQVDQSTNTCVIQALSFQSKWQVSQFEPLKKSWIVIMKQSMMKGWNQH